MRFSWAQFAAPLEVAWHFAIELTDLMLGAVDNSRVRWRAVGEARFYAQTSAELVSAVAPDPPAVFGHLPVRFLGRTSSSSHGEGAPRSPWAAGNGRRPCRNLPTAIGSCFLAAMAGGPTVVVA